MHMYTHTRTYAHTQKDINANEYADGKEKHRIAYSMRIRRIKEK